jgi:hypothetical protein
MFESKRPALDWGNRSRQKPAAALPRIKQSHTIYKEQARLYNGNQQVVYLLVPPAPIGSQAFG